MIVIWPNAYKPSILPHHFNKWQIYAEVIKPQIKATQNSLFVQNVTSSQNIGNVGLCLAREVIKHYNRTKETVMLWAW